jgi:hypothetical protein
MNLMSGKRATAPVCSRLRIVRVVSKTNSTPRFCASVSVSWTPHAAQYGWHAFAPIHLFEQRRVDRIAKVLAGVA